MHASDIYNLATIHECATILLRYIIYIVIPPFHGRPQSPYLHRCVYSGITSRNRTSAAIRVVTARVHSSCDRGISVLNYCHSWDKFVNTHLSHSRHVVYHYAVILICHTMLCRP